MKLKALMCLAALVGGLAPLAEVKGDAEWIGGSGSPLNIWSDPANWNPAFVPASATVRGEPGNEDKNVARFKVDGTTTLIDSSVNAVAFAVQLGHPKPGTLGDQSASNTLNMTGGTLTTQGNFLFNVGRGRNPASNPGHLVQFNVSGGVVNAAGITVPEAFNPDNVLGFTSGGLNAQMHVSGNAIVNTDLLRLGAQDSNSLVTISDNGQINLTNDNLGFAPGTLWIEHGELASPRGTSLLDIRDNGVLTVHGEWYTDENGDTVRGAATQTEFQWYLDNYVTPGYIVANGGANKVFASFSNGVMTFRAIPEPSSLILATACFGGLALLRRRGR